MKKVFITIFTVFSLSGLSACSDKTSELVSNFVGYWEIIPDALDPYDSSVLKIYEEGGEFYADIDVLSSKAPDGGAKVPAKLTVHDNDLNISSPFLNGSIVYYSDSNRIVIGNQTSYNRMTKDQFHLAKLQYDQCKELKGDYLAKAKALSYGFEDSKKRDELKELTNQNIKGLERCRPLF